MISQLGMQPKSMGVTLNYEQLLLDDIDSLEWDKELHLEFDGFELEI